MTHDSLFNTWHYTVLLLSFLPHMQTVWPVGNVFLCVLCCRRAWEWDCSARPALKILKISCSLGEEVRDHPALHQKRRNRIRPIQWYDCLVFCWKKSQATGLRVASPKIKVPSLYYLWHLLSSCLSLSAVTDAVPETEIQERSSTHTHPRQRRHWSPPHWRL